MTNRPAEAVSQLLLSSNILAVARFFQLIRHTVKALDKAALQNSVREPDWSLIRYLAMDEFVLDKGHRYATVVVDQISRQVLRVGQANHGRQSGPSLNNASRRCRADPGGGHDDGL